MMIIALVLALIGAGLMFIYVSQANKRADEQYGSSTVLQVVETINPGESIDSALAAGKIDKVSVANKDVLPTALTDVSGLSGQVAIQTLFPGEQIIPEKFGTSAGGPVLPIPDNLVAVAVNLTDPGRVAGFVNTDSDVAVFVSGTDIDSGKPFTLLLLKRVRVIGVGSTSVTSTTTTDETGAQTTEQLPRTLLTLAVDIADAQKLQYAASTGELSFALLTEKSKVTSLPAETGVRPAA